MAIITVTCHTTASEEILQYLWEMMTNVYTPLVNELLSRVNSHSDLQDWLKQGYIPTNIITDIYDSLIQEEPRFKAQPGRFKSSASALVKDIYKSWFAVYKNKSLILKGKLLWLETLRSDVQLITDSGKTLSQIKKKAIEIKNKTVKEIEEGSLSNSEHGKDFKFRLMNKLFETHKKSKSIFSKCAIVYLIKNNCSIPEQEEDPQEYQKYYRAKEIETERLIKQLQACLPKPRDLTNDIYINALEHLTTSIPSANDDGEFEEEEEAFKKAMHQLFQRSKSLPFPVNYGSNLDLSWFKNNEGKICLKLNGLSKYPLEIRCHSRQYHWFQRFWEDWQLYEKFQNEIPAGLMTLCSARLIWQEGLNKGEPWKANHLTLHCSLEHLLWTQQGTEQCRTEKIMKTTNMIESFQNKLQENGRLTSKQQDKLKSLQSSLHRLKHFNNFSRPNQEGYEGVSCIAIGLHFGLKQKIAVAAVDLSNHKILEYKETKQILGTDSHLLQKYEQKRQKNTHQRHQAQQKGSSERLYGEANLGLHINRLLAQEIINFAQKYEASLIVVPKLDRIRETVESQIKAEAEQKCVGYKTGQKKYKKKHRVKIHRWSYAQLGENIQLQAQKIGIEVLEVQSTSDASQPYEKARDLAIKGYKSIHLSSSDSIRKPTQ